MLNFDFKRSSRKCSRTDRTIQPGETFYSVLVESGDDTERLDFCAEAWEAPPDDCIGWWKSQVPEAGKGKIYWAPREVLLAYFDHLLQQPSDADTAYVMALLLVQKRILSINESVEDDQHFHLDNRRDKTSFIVPIASVEPERIAQIQDELGERLFSDQPFDTDDEDADDEEG